MSDAPNPELIPMPKRRRGGGNYTQINVMLPSTQVELPSPDKFNAFPPEAREVILEAVKREQQSRHVWLMKQQSNDHAFNMQSSRLYYRWRFAGTICGTIVMVVALGIGAFLVKNGAQAAGVGLMIASVLLAVGSAIYGVTSRDKEDKDKEAKSNDSAPNDEELSGETTTVETKTDAI